nr:undecaprenyl diphosphate synthase family protein [Gammaproteobacteria bacterium]
MSNNSNPKHVAIIMDGNGRWAASRHMPRYFGHSEGFKAVEQALNAAVKNNIEYLTLFAFS